MTAFDTPRTKAMAAFLKSEGPDGSGRVVGLSIEPDGVFIYTASAAWCDDSGAGTFRGDSETGAIAAFKARVRPGNGCPIEPAPADSTVPAGPCGCAACLSGRHAVTGNATGDARASALAPSESFATVYRNAAPDGRPVATVSRPRRGDSHGLFTLCDTSGRLVKSWTRMPTLAAVRAALVNVAELAEELADTPTAEEAEERAAVANAHGVDARERARREGPGTPRRALLLNLASLSARRAEIYADRAAALKAAELADGAENCTCLECGNGFHMGPRDVQICPRCYPEERAAFDAPTLADAPAWSAPVDVDSAIRAARVSGPFPSPRDPAEGMALETVAATSGPAESLDALAEHAARDTAAANDSADARRLARYNPAVASHRAAARKAGHAAEEAADALKGEERAAMLETAATHFDKAAANPTPGGQPLGHYASRARVIREEVAAIRGRVELDSRRPRSLSAAATPARVLYLAAEGPGAFYLYTDSGVWTGPGLGRFDSARAARVWASRRGYEVAELVTAEELTTVRAAAMRASVPALQAAARRLASRAHALPALQAAAARVRVAVVQEVAELKAGAIRAELADAFALRVRPSEGTPGPAAFRKMRAALQAAA